MGSAVRRGILLRAVVPQGRCLLYCCLALRDCSIWFVLRAAGVPLMKLGTPSRVIEPQEPDVVVCRDYATTTRVVEDSPAMGDYSVALNGHGVVLGVEGLTYEGIALTHPLSDYVLAS